MRFQNGKLGACIVVVALLLTVTFGFVGSGERVSSTERAYDYVTDVTGLFESTPVPQYIDYNPSTNYTGYTGQVNYTVSSSPNNYRFVQSEGGTTTNTFTIDNSTLITGSVSNTFSLSEGGYLFGYSGDSYTFPSNEIGYANKITYNGRSTASMTDGTITYRVCTLKQMLQQYNSSYIDYASVTLTVSQGSYPVIFTAESAQERTYVAWAGAPLDPYNVTVKYYSITDSSIPDKLVINSTTEVVKAYRGDTELYTKELENVTVLYGYTVDGTITTSVASATITAVMQEPPVYAYADPTGGVNFAQGETVTWNNNYIVDEITLLVGKNPYYSSTGLHIAFMRNGGSTGSTEVIINLYSGSLTVQASGGEVINVGMWQGAIVKFNFETGRLSVTPTGSITNYTTLPSIIGSEIVLAEGQDNLPDLTSTELTLGMSSKPTCQFGVYNTSVNLNTYGVVLENPSIDIRNYWTQIKDYRLNFYSFALVGDSVTINNVKYEVDQDTQTITVKDVTTDKEYTQTLSNIYVTVLNTSSDPDAAAYHTYLTFGDTKTLIDLGETVTDTVSFEGMWYFTTGLYETYLETVTKYDFTFGTWGMSYLESIVIYIGIALGGIVVCRVMGKKLSTLDFVILGGALIIVLFAGDVMF